ncbi:MAG: hypothetical protein U0172_04450 [Nitrospiraceae bacterium]
MPHSLGAQQFGWSTSAVASLVVPGLGRCLAGQLHDGLSIGAMTAGLIGLGMAVGRFVGLSAELFWFVTVLLPFWVLQTYDAGLAIPPRGLPLSDAARLAWSRAHDIRYLGALFILVAAVDAYIILATPNYALSLFCTKPDGLLGILVKIQSPTLHVLIGYGFLRLRRWALLLYLAYAGFGLLNATVNLACVGYGRVRMVFLLSLVAFTAYVWLRRRRFDAQPEATAA